MQQPTISRSTPRGAIDTTYMHQNQDLDIVPAYLPKPYSRVWVIRDQDDVQYAGRQGRVDLIQQMEEHYVAHTHFKKPPICLLIISFILI